MTDLSHQGNVFSFITCRTVHPTGQVSLFTFSPHGPKLNQALQDHISPNIITLYSFQCKESCCLIGHQISVSFIVNRPVGSITIKRAVNKSASQAAIRCVINKLLGLHHLIGASWLFIQMLSDTALYVYI